MTILIFCEFDNGTIKKSSLELISKANDLRCSPDEEIILETLNPHDDAWALCEIIAKIKPRIILASNSTTAKDIFPRIAARMKIGLATDVVDLKMADNRLVAKKPLYSGKVFCEVHFSTEIQMALVRPNSFSINISTISIPTSTRRHVDTSAQSHSSRASARLLETHQDTTSQHGDITEAEIIVAGGRGMTSAENFNILNELAETLG